MLNLQEAVDKVKSQAATSKAPTLSNDEVIEIVEETQRAVLWQASTVYSYGDRVMPTARNGHHYIVVRGGTSGATEPDWLMGALSDHGYPYSETPLFNSGAEGYIVASGTVLLRENGADWKEIYDVRAATHKAWLTKAGLASDKFDASVDNQRADRSQIHKHCLEMAARYKPVGV